MEDVLLVRWSELSMHHIRWKYCINAALENYKTSFRNMCIEKQRGSSQRFYRRLGHETNYIRELSTTSDIALICRARCDVLNLNGNRFENTADKTCPICNTGDVENLLHFLGRCEKLKECRHNFLEKYLLSEYDLIEILNGVSYPWKKVATYLKKALNERTKILSE